MPCTIIFKPNTVVNPNHHPNHSFRPEGCFPNFFFHLPFVLLTLYFLTLSECLKSKENTVATLAMLKISQQLLGDQWERKQITVKGIWGLSFAHSFHNSQTVSEGSVESGSV